MQSTEAYVLGTYSDVSDQYMEVPLKPECCDRLVQAPIRSHTLRSVQSAKENVHDVTANRDGNEGSGYKEVLQRDPAILAVWHSRN